MSLSYTKGYIAAIIATFQNPYTTVHVKISRLQDSAHIFAT
jgi:hypothetical protein